MASFLMGWRWWRIGGKQRLALVPSSNHPPTGDCKIDIIPNAAVWSEL
ncbi:hypothetical protein IFO70_23820 [Phormidium tenue FACHB-886]|nr:hypothetical protein [Phormidium tenue FACHB-886]